MSEPSTPLMRQYSAIKKEHPAALLFFRLGDFYEMFFEDAVVASKELEITLTSRNKEKGLAILRSIFQPGSSAPLNFPAKVLRKKFKTSSISCAPKNCSMQVPPRCLRPQAI